MSNQIATARFCAFISSFIGAETTVEQPRSSMHLGQCMIISSDENFGLQQHHGFSPYRAAQIASAGISLP